MSGELNFSATLHRKFYQAMPTAQQAYLLLEAAPAASASHTQSVNFALVLDHSGSMAGAKLSYLKDAAKWVIDRLGPKDLITVIVFDDEQPADLLVPSQPVIERDTLKSRIDSIQERGGTHMSTGMSLGLNELQKGKSPARVSGMLLLTDGQTWEDRADCLELADRFRDAGLPIYALGLGVGEESNWDPRLLEEIALRSGGEWFVADKPEAVSNVFQKTLGSLQDTAITNVQLTMRLAERLTPRFLWRVLPLIGRLDQRMVGEHDVQVFLGDISHSNGQSLLIDMLIPALAPGWHRLIQADLTYDIPATGMIAQRISLEIPINITEDISQAQYTEARVMNIVERVVAHKLQTQALDEAADGEIGKATQRLRAVATRLLELGEAELADQAQQQAAKIEQGGQMDVAAAQRMRYATKRLTEVNHQD